MENQIRGTVFSRFNSIESFAREIGWKRNKASRIVNGIQRPSADDMEQMAKCLKIPDAQAFCSIFFPGLTTK
ncbi:MAG: helix-turn-helix transcriptional regulator [Lachnospiraceae bacterium]|nr:helix-turn-helix transcriptional regulator [Lachnospiraceae bacterium]